MQAKKCDRCGKYYSCYHDSYPISKSNKVNGIMLIDINDNGERYMRHNSFDICQDCMRDFTEWLLHMQDRQ